MKKILVFVALLSLMSSQAFAFEKHSGVAFSDNSLLAKQFYFQRVSELRGTVIFAWAPSVVPGGEFRGRRCYYYLATIGVPPEKVDLVVRAVRGIADNPNVHYRIFSRGRQL